jgi:hypothetical protein
MHIHILTARMRLSAKAKIILIKICVWKVSALA